MKLSQFSKHYKLIPIYFFILLAIILSIYSAIHYLKLANLYIVNAYSFSIQEWVFWRNIILFLYFVCYFPLLIASQLARYFFPKIPSLYPGIKPLLLIFVIILLSFYPTHFASKIFSSYVKENIKNSQAPTYSPIPSPTTYILDDSLPSNWRKYTNPENTFTISYPPSWVKSIISTLNDGQYFTKNIIFSGNEGSVEVSWTNDGYGGGCDPQDAAIITTRVNSYKMCHSIRDNDQEYFGQIYKKSISKNSVHIWTYASALVATPTKTNKKLVLTILTSIVLK